MKEWFLLINPFAAGGKAIKKKDVVLKLLKDAGIPHETAISDSREDATRVIHDAVEAGYRKFIAVGGDGTLNSLVTGIFQQQKVSPSEIMIAIIPVGTGNDWIKTHHIPNSISKSIGIIKNGRTVFHDIGILTPLETTHALSPDQTMHALSPDQTTHALSLPRYFINVAGFAFQGFVAERIEGTSNWLKIGPGAFYLGLVEALFRYRATDVSIVMGNEHAEGKFFNISIGVCNYAGGGMKVTPDAIVDDGLLDITVSGDLGKWEVIKNIPRLFSGAFVSHPKISQFKTKKISISSVPPAPIETDGEVVGYGDWEIGIIQKGIRVIVG